MNFITSFTTFSYNFTLINTTFSPIGVKPILPNGKYSLSLHSESHPPVLAEHSGGGVFH